MPHSHRTASEESDGECITASVVDPGSEDSQASKEMANLLRHAAYMKESLVLAAKIDPGLETGSAWDLLETVEDKGRLMLELCDKVKVLQRSAEDTERNVQKLACALATARQQLQWSVLDLRMSHDLSQAVVAMQSVRQLKDQIDQVLQEIEPWGPPAGQTETAWEIDSMATPTSSVRRTGGEDWDLESLADSLPYAQLEVVTFYTEQAGDLLAQVELVEQRAKVLQKQFEAASSSQTLQATLCADPAGQCLERERTDGEPSPGTADKQVQEIAQLLAERSSKSPTTLLNEIAWVVDPAALDGSEGTAPDRSAKPASVAELPPSPERQPCRQRKIDDQAEASITCAAQAPDPAEFWKKTYRCEAKALGMEAEAMLADVTMSCTDTETTVPRFSAREFMSERSWDGESDAGSLRLDRHDSCEDTDASPRFGQKSPRCGWDEVRHWRRSSKRGRRQEADEAQAQAGTWRDWVKSVWNGCRQPSEELGDEMMMPSQEPAAGTFALPTTGPLDVGTF